MKIIARLNKILLLSFIVSIVSLLIDWSTTLLYFQHIPDFVEGNPLVSSGLFSIETSVIPIVAGTVIMYAILYLVNVRTESVLIEGFTLGLFLIVPFLNLGAFVFNFAHINLRLTYFMCTITRLMITVILSLIWFLFLKHSKMIEVKL